jgi:outer membrane protein OmpA-like peptidoglycan-associated protein
MAALTLPVQASAEQQGTKSLEEIMRGLLDTDGTSRGMGSVAKEQKEAPAPGQARIAVPIQFEYNSAAVSSASREQLEIIAKALDSDELKPFRIGIEGHTDQSGTADYNLRLSEERAQAVKKYLAEKLGVSAARLDAHGYGKSRPLPGVSQTTEDGRALNRRVELVNLGKSGAAGAAPAAAKAPSKPSVRVAVHYRKSGEVEVLKPGGTLQSNDTYRVSFVADQDAHVYLYQIDSSGKAQTLFPNAKLSPAANPVQANQSVDLPPEGEWLTLDANRGEEQIVAVASKKELADPKSIALDQWSSVANDVSGASRGIAAAPRPGYSAGPGGDVFLDRFPFQHK